MRKAVCVGINDYPGYYNDLNGCINDVNGWANLLMGTFDFDVKQIVNSSATKENILFSLEELVEEAVAGDVIVFTYSGHGTQVSDTSGDEEDYYDEALYVYNGTILDDEFRTVLNKLEEDVTAYVILDSCFSGTMTRILGEGRRRFVETDVVVGKTLKKEFLKEEDMKELLLTGCSDSEYSYDAYIDGDYNGAMSYYAIKNIQEDTTNTWEEFYSLLREDLPNSSYPQTPQLEGTEELKQLELFDSKESEPVEPVEPVENDFYELVLKALLNLFRMLVDYLEKILGG